MQTVYCVIIRKIFGIFLLSCGSPGANEMIKFILEEESVVSKNCLCQQKRKSTLDDKFDKRRGRGVGGVHFSIHFGSTYASIPNMTCNVHSSPITDVKSFVED